MRIYFCFLKIEVSEYMGMNSMFGLCKAPKIREDYSSLFQTEILIFESRAKNCDKDS